ncbi:MAG: hypothetical protein H7Y22_15275 [Gemmatimonadaceae bacterium]|nr:hypothetical protein [Gloeobacterales cyanobacterium ES-bin-141]
MDTQTPVLPFITGDLWGWSLSIGSVVFLYVWGFPMLFEMLAKYEEQRLQKKLARGLPKHIRQNSNELAAQMSLLHCAYQQPSLICILVLPEQHCCGLALIELVLPPTCQVVALVREGRLLLAGDYLYILPGDWIMGVALNPVYRPRLAAALKGTSSSTCDQHIR